jgi:hypothetical protein
LPTALAPIYAVVGQVPMRLILLPLLAAVIQVQTASAEISDDTLRRKIADLHDDGIPDNCGDAVTFFSAHSREKKVQSALLNEFNKTTDPQTKEECMVLLCHAPGFQPDEQFMRAVLKRLHEYGKPSMMSPGDEPAGNAGAGFLVTQIRHFPDLILSEIHDDFAVEDLWVQYVVIRALDKAGLLKSYEKRFSESFLKRLAGHLQSDDISRNATTAANAFISLGKIGVSALRNVPTASDLQGRQLALAILSHLSGKISSARLYETAGDLGVTLTDLDSGSHYSSRSEYSDTSEAPDSESETPSPSPSVHSTALPGFRVQLMITYAYKGKNPPASPWLRGDSSQENIIGASERENLGASHAVKDGDETSQLLEASSKLAPVRFSVRLERKAGRSDPILTVTAEDSATGKALGDYPKTEDLEVLELLAKEAGHHFEIVFLPSQQKKVREVLRAAVVRDEGEMREGLRFGGGYLLIGR